MAVAAGAEPLGSSLLASVGVLLFVGPADHAAWHQFGHFGGQRGGRVASKLPLLALVLLQQTPLVGLAHVFPALPSNLVDRPENNLFGCASSWAAMLGEVANVAAGDIGRTIDGESNAVGDLAAPSFGVETGLVPGLLTSIHVHPASLMFRVHFGPDVVLRVPYPADPGPHGAAKHAEAVGPFATSASP